jgi:hypothetical protein
LLTSKKGAENKTLPFFIVEEKLFEKSFLSFFIGEGLFEKSPSPSPTSKTSLACGG